MATEKMNVNERYKCVRALKPEYHKARRKEKAQMLTMVQGLTGLSRKYLSTLLHSPGPHRRPRRRERSRIYDDQVDAAIAVIARTLDWICAERLKPVLVEMAEVWVENLRL